MKLNKCIITLSASALLISQFALSQNWRSEHPRRAEVNERLRHENRRINEGVRSGEISHEEAREMKQDLRTIRKEERKMASDHNGHISRKEQKELNQQENQVSKEIERR